METNRLASVDVMRGLTVAAMILVNTPGSWNHVFSPLRHAPWHGWSPADLIFPFFIFIVGISVALSLGARKQAAWTKGALIAKILARTAILFALGLFLNFFPDFHPADVRLPGVLQRIAFCYLFAALAYLTAGKTTRLASFLVLTAGYWLALKLIPVPGIGPGELGAEGNLPGFIDGRILGGHLYKPGFDPEGLLSTLPAVATALLGTLAGDLLRTNKTLVRKAAAFLGYGAALTAAGLLLHPQMPINKQLWTSTFVLFTGGAALLLLGTLMFAIELFRFRSWAYPFFVLGTNAIGVFFLSSLTTKILLWIKIGVEGSRQPLYSWIYRNLFASWAGADLGSLIFALAAVSAWAAAAAPLYRRRIFIKV
ncbi:MAG: DUF1624 domain-containing protein [Candidatus Aminicenantes bacterium]|nr:DUF1624 domain-containing protein [Candidatus Aminicenantes bacterium]